MKIETAPAIDPTRTATPAPPLDGPAAAAVETAPPLRLPPAITAVTPEQGVNHAGGGFIGVPLGGGHSQYWASPQVPLTDPFQKVDSPAIPPEAFKD